MVSRASADAIWRRMLPHGRFADGRRLRTASRRGMARIRPVARQGRDAVTDRRSGRLRPSRSLRALPETAGRGAWRTDGVEGRRTVDGRGLSDVLRRPCRCFPGLAMSRCRMPSGRHSVLRHGRRRRRLPSFRKSGRRGARWRHDFSGPTTPRRCAVTWCRSADRQHSSNCLYPLNLLDFTIL